MDRKRTVCTILHGREKREGKGLTHQNAIHRQERLHDDTNEGRSMASYEEVRILYHPIRRSRDGIR